MMAVQVNGKTWSGQSELFMSVLVSRLNGK